MTDHLNAPHGGVLVDLMASADRRTEIRDLSRDWASWDLTPRQICDLELLLNGGFSPLTGFMTSGDYNRVCSDMRLQDGTLWPMPIALDVPESLASTLSVGDNLALRDPEGVMLATLHIEDVWRPDLAAEAEQVFGTNNLEHPGVSYLLSQSHPVYLGGRLEGLELPIHYDFRQLRKSPAALREEFASRGWTKVVAFQTRNPMHRAHVELTMRGAAEAGANILIHPSVGMTKPGDVDHYTRVRCYQAVLERYPANTAALALLPLAMRMGGPREAVWHAIIRKNHGCTHLVVGRDHAGPGSDSTGKPFYGPYDAQELLAKHETELGMGMVDFRMMVYAPDDGHATSRRTRYPRASRPSTSPEPSSGIGWPPDREIPSVVHLSRGGHRTAPDPSAPRPAGFHRLLHGAFRLGQVDHRQRPARQALGDGRPAGDDAGRRSGSKEPFLGARASRGSTVTSTSVASDTWHRR